MNSSQKIIQKWKVLDSKELFKAGFFKLRTDRCELPDARVMPHYYVFEFRDWVNVVAVTKSQQMILVEQYRHACEEVALEIPGGSTDPQDANDHAQAASRELIEETGYQAKKLLYVGRHRPNPAMQNNWMHTYLALECEKIAEQSLDPFEDMRVLLVPIKEAYEMTLDGRINHSIVMASMLMARQQLSAENLL